MAGHTKKRLGIAAPGNGSWPQFEKGSTGQVVHGASTPRLVSPMADIIAREWLDSPGAAPEYLTRPMFAASFGLLCEAQAQLFLYGTWMETLPDGKKYLAVGAQAPPIERYGKLQRRVLELLTACGLTPLSHARIGKALSAQARDIAMMVAEAARSGNWGDDDPDGDDQV